MTTDQILSLGPQLADFLGEFDDCLMRVGPVRASRQLCQRTTLRPDRAKRAAHHADFPPTRRAHPARVPRLVALGSRSLVKARSRATTRLCAITPIPRPSASSTIPAIPNPATRPPAGKRQWRQHRPRQTAVSSAFISLSYASFDTRPHHARQRAVSPELVERSGTLPRSGHSRRSRLPTQIRHRP